MELQIRKDSPALECAPKTRTGRTSCNVLHPNAVLPMLELNCLGFDSSRFLEVQLIGNPEPFPWPRPDGQAPEKISVVHCVLLDRVGAFLANLFCPAGRRVMSGPTVWPGPAVALLLSKVSPSPSSRWELRAVL